MQHAARKLYGATLVAVAVGFGPTRDVLIGCGQLGAEKMDDLAQRRCADACLAKN